MDIFRSLCVVGILACMLVFVWTIAFNGIVFATLNIVVAVIVTLIVFLAGSVIWENYF